MDRIYIRAYYATIKGHILGNYLMARENAPSVLSGKQMTELNNIAIS